MSPDATYADPSTLRPLPVAELATHLSRIWDVWGDQVYSATTVVTSEHAAAVEWRVQQTHQSGKVLPLQGVFILEVVGGRIHGARSYYNAIPYLQFLAPGRG
jgi:ketosteroid isomerase-like protein